MKKLGLGISILVLVLIVGSAFVFTRPTPPLNTYTFVLLNLSDQETEKEVVEKIKAIPNVESAMMNIETKVINISFKNQDLSMASLIQEMNKKGYKAKPMLKGTGDLQILDYSIQFK